MAKFHKRRPDQNKSSVKLKSLPDDFEVEEITQFEIDVGPFSVYRLEKRSIGTPEAIQAILRQWNLSRSKVSYGGLKDRHACTRQTITIHDGPRKDLVDRSFSLIYLGQAKRAFLPHDIQANRFDIVLRGIRQEQVREYRHRLELLRESGIMNYFDDQRFGSLGISGQFVAQPWCMTDYERAMYLALAEENTHDRPREKEQKAILRECWGKWDECKERLDRSHRRSIVTYLCDHPSDFRRAIALIRIDLRSIYVAAFQSFLWNRWLSAMLDEYLPDDQRTQIPSKCGSLTVPKQMTAEQKLELATWELPLPSARQKEWEPKSREKLDAILESIGMSVNLLRLKFPRDTFFSKGVRQCWLGSPDLSYEFSADELHRGRHCVQLHFSLPRGSYATMIVKWVTSTEPPDEPLPSLDEE
jgi:tRNA pseudouridine13 synthase